MKMFFVHFLAFFKINAFYGKYKLRGNFAVQFVSCEHQFVRCEHLPHFTIAVKLKLLV